MTIRITNNEMNRLRNMLLLNYGEGTLYLFSDPSLGNGIMASYAGYLVHVCWDEGRITYIPD